MIFAGGSRRRGSRTGCKDKGKLELSEATTFEAGSNRWKSRGSWPPRIGVIDRQLYFRADSALDFAPQHDSSGGVSDSYVSNPASPVPYRARPILPTYGEGSTWSRWLVDDQRFLKGRHDVLS